MRFWRLYGQSIDCEADRLILSAPKSSEYAAYTNPYFERKLRRDNAKILVLGVAAISDPANVLGEIEACEIVAHARLAPAQLEAVELYMQGLSMAEIGAACHYTRQGAFSILKQAKKKLAVSAERFKYRGLMQCYFEDVRRKGHGGRR